MEKIVKNTHEVERLAQVTPEQKEASIESNERAELVEQFLALQLEIMELEKAHRLSVEHAIDPGNKDMKDVYTKVGKKFYEMIESLKQEKEEMESLLKEKGLEPGDYTFQ